MGRDGEGRLCAVFNRTLNTYTRYVYDASGRRVAKAQFSGPLPATNAVCAVPGTSRGFSGRNCNAK